jgi:hypothetical protein
MNLILIFSIIIKLLKLLGDKDIGDEDLRTCFEKLKRELHDGIIEIASENKGRD